MCGKPDRGSGRGTGEAKEGVAFLKSKCLPICLNRVLLAESLLAGIP